MEENNEKRSKWFKVRLTPNEEALLVERVKKSTSQNLSEYARATILGKPVTVLYRDKSMDEMLEELALLRRELNFIGNNLNQVVKQINSTLGFPDAGLWMQLLTLIKGRVEPSIAEIKGRMNKYSDLWSQKLKAEKA
jgi:hypothetical protein